MDGEQGCEPRIPPFETSAPMVVDDLYLLRALAGPPETNPVAVIDPDTVLAPPIAAKSLKAIARRGPQVLNGSCRLNLV